MSKLILIRHGQSRWNLENRFTGWEDVDLSPAGEEEARNAGELLRGTSIDYVYTSVLKRSIRTAELVLEVMGIHSIDRLMDQALNERHYGDLQGMNKDECRERFGVDQVKIWRRSFDIAPPNGESLKDTQDRVLPYYEREIAPKLREGNNVLVVAHGNSLRALVMMLEGLSKEEVLELNIPTGQPKVYELDENLNIVENYYIADKQSAQ